MSNEDKREATLSDIYREVGETKVSVNSLNDKVEKHIDTTQGALKEINDLDAQQNLILNEHKLSLDKHIEGVNTLRDMHVAHRKETAEQITLLKEGIQLQREECTGRLEALEKPYDFLKFLGKVGAWVSTIAGAIYMLMKLSGKV